MLAHQNMKSSQWGQWLALPVVGAILAIIALYASVFAADASKKIEPLNIEVAQDMTTFRADEAPVHEDGMPAFGNAFVIQGFIYPEGTLEDGNGIVITEDENGNSVAQPEFPDKVLGIWTCRGYFVGEGLHTTEGAWAITTQFFAFNDELGSKTLVSEGYELPSTATKTLQRAITGGTGHYAGAEGIQEQVRIGTNVSGATNFDITFELLK